MTHPSPNTPVVELQRELVECSRLLHHYERDHLEYGVPGRRDEPITRDPLRRTLADLERICESLRERIRQAQVADQQAGRLTRRWRRHRTRRDGRG